MKSLVIGAAVVGAGAFALRRLAIEARKMHAHCCEMIAAYEQSKPNVSPSCGA